MVIGRSIRTLGLGSLALLLGTVPAHGATPVIHAGSIIRDAAGEASGPATITVTDGKIVSVADGILPAPEGAKTIELMTRPCCRA